MHFSIWTLFSLAVVLPVVAALPYEERATNDEMVMTPFGRKPKSSMFLVPQDAKIQHMQDGFIQVIHNGKVIYKNSKLASNDIPAPASVSRFSSGWVAYATFQVSTSTPISSFSTTWTVPENPSTNSGQTVFLFNGMEPSSLDSILQPVLQWGPSAVGGGASWAVASWYVTPSNTFFSPLVGVSVGQTLTGVISYDSTINQYTSSFTQFPECTLVTSDGPQLVWATETLEAYGITAKSDYPTGSTAFTNINLAGPSSVSWSSVSNSADGLTTTIVQDGGSNAEIDIKYT